MNNLNIIKQLFLLTALLLSLNSCRNEGKPVQTTKVDTFLIDEKEEDTKDTLPVFSYNPEQAIWVLDYDSITNAEQVRKQKHISEDSLTIQVITSLLNETYPFVQIGKVESVRDTVFVHIPNSEVLTQQMGTYGAFEYLVAATYSYTDLQGIEFVVFDFKEGDHAAPGLYDRSSWNITIKE